MENHKQGSMVVVNKPKVGIFAYIINLFFGDFFTKKVCPCCSLSRTPDPRCKGNLCSACCTHYCNGVCIRLDIFKDFLERIKTNHKFIDNDDRSGIKCKNCGYFVKVETDTREGISCSFGFNEKRKKTDILSFEKIIADADMITDCNISLINNVINK